MLSLARDVGLKGGEERVDQGGFGDDIGVAGSCTESGRVTP